MAYRAIHFKKSYDKIIETVVWLASRKPGIDIYHIAKVLFFADKLHVNRYARPVTTDTYNRLPYGPVPSTVRNIITMDSWLSPQQMKNIEDSIFVGPKRDYYKTTALRAPNLSYFSQSDLECLEESLEKYGDMSFDELYILTHQERCYQETEDNDKIDYSLLVSDDNPHKDDIISHMRETSQYIQA